MLCKYRQWLIDTALDGGRELPPGLVAHLARCDRCHAHYREARRVDLALRQTAPDESEPLPPFLAAKALSAVRRAEAEKKPSCARRPLWLPALALGSVLLLVVAGHLYRQHRIESKQRQAAAQMLALGEGLLSLDASADGAADIEGLLAQALTGELAPLREKPEEAEDFVRDFVPTFD